MSCFPQGAHDPIEQKIDRALGAILRLFQAAHPVVIAYSGGKDSSVVAALVLHAALLHRAAGGEPLVIVTTSDTKVKSPEVNLHYRAELKRMRAFGEQHGFTVIAKVVEPQLASTFQVKVLTGRALPSFPGLHGDCSVDLKIAPQRAFRRQLFRSLAERGAAAPVTCLGTRFDEGARRASGMRQRRESADTPASNKDGELVLSPIAHWNSDAVWEAIALYGGGSRPGYSDFEETRRLYAHSVGTSCAVVADAILEGTSGRKQGKCGARLGCHVCQMAEDTRFDWRRRHWVGRTIRGGFIKVQPDTYHPTMLRELSRYMLQLDIHQRGIRFDIPEVPAVAQTTVPTPRFLHVGSEWDELAPAAEWTGMRDPFIEAMTAESPCEPEIMVTAGERTLWRLPTEQSFSVDFEAACMLQDFELDRMLETHDMGLQPGQITVGYRWYLQYGVPHAVARTADRARRGVPPHGVQGPVGPDARVRY